MTTDPYAVVPAQRRPAPAPPPPAPPAPARPSGQIGGRAMIGPGESLTDRLKALRRRNEAAASEAETLTHPVSPATGAPMHAGPSAYAGAPSHGPAYAGRPGPHPSSPTTGEMPAVPWALPNDPYQPSGSYPPGSYGSQPGPRPLAGAQRAAAGLLGRVRRWPRSLQLGAAGVLAAVLAVTAFALLPGGGDGTTPPPPTGAGPTTPAAAAFETKTEAARGLSVNVPEEWQRKTSGGVWVDFVDPDDADRKVRILVEKSSADPMKFLESAAGRLRQNASGTCARPYTQVALQEVELSGQPASELEYTCGAGDAMRHGVWRAVVVGGKAYSFFLTTDDARFAESRPIFEEMVRTFEVTAAG
jgi:hypothetical protein